MSLNAAAGISASGRPSAVSVGPKSKLKKWNTRIEHMSAMVASKEDMITPRKSEEYLSMLKHYNNKRDEFRQRIEDGTCTWLKGKGHTDAFCYYARKTWNFGVLLTTEVPNNYQLSAKSSEPSTSDSSSSLPNELLYSSLPSSYSKAVGNGAISDDTEDDSDSDSNNMAPEEVEADLRRQMLKQRDKRQFVTCEGERFCVTIIIVISTAIVAVVLGISRRNAQAIQDNQFGLLELAPGIDPAVDIVAIHGLDGHRIHSWTAENGVCWLRDGDLLPFRVPKARIFTYGYDANTRDQDQFSSQSLYSHAQSLISNLALERQTTETEERPIIFVAHSLGGIVLKNALMHAHLATKGHLFAHKAVALSTYGIFFLGTPHQGTQNAEFARILLNIQAITRPVNDALLKHLSRNSESLEQQLSQFVSISEDFVIKFGFETYPTNLGGGFKELIVPRAFAVVPGTANAEAISINKNHVDMCKFLSVDDEDFKTIWKHLSIMAKAAPHKIAKNWEQHRHSDHGV